MKINFLTRMPLHIIRKFFRSRRLTFVLTLLLVGTALNFCYNFYYNPWSTVALSISNVETLTTPDKPITFTFNRQTGNIRTNFIYKHTGKPLEGSDGNKRFRIVKPLFNFTAEVGPSLAVRKGRGRSEEEDPPASLPSLLPIESDEEKLVLFYTLKNNEPWLYNWPTDGNLHFLDSPMSCPKKCVFTYNKTLSKYASAVLWHVSDILYYWPPGDKTHPNVKTKTDKQLWVAVTWEAAKQHKAKLLGSLNYLFNWVVSYRLDSDVYWPYGFFYKLDVPKKRGEINQTNVLLLRKKKLIASLISNCDTPGKREIMLHFIRIFTEVDTYGLCGENECPPNRDCREYIAENYKFILAFESVLCQDYITDEFFSAFPLGIVPVAYGLGDYAEVAPPHSYINALEFTLVSNLTDYLLYLDGNEEEYLKYFDWQLEYEFRDTGHIRKEPVEEKLMYCNFCVKLWEFQGSKRSKVMPEGFRAWWHHKRELGEHLYRRNDTPLFRTLQKRPSACVGEPRIKPDVRP